MAIYTQICLKNLYESRTSFANSIHYWVQLTTNPSSANTAFSGGNIATYTNPSTLSEDRAYTCTFTLYDEEFSDRVSIDVMSK